MKALSIQQPWAWLIVNGFKRVENRRWKTGYKGPLAITSSDDRFFEGPYGFTFKNAKPCRLIPMIGKLSFFEVELEVLP